MVLSFQAHHPEKDVIEAISALKSNVLLSCGWRILPLKKKLLEFEGSYWCKPGEKDKLNLNDAWEEHMYELKSGIECDIPPPPPKKPIQEEETVEEAVSQSQDDMKEKKKKPRKESKLKIDPAIVPKHVQNMMASRARFVSDGDPRPSMHCTWCKYSMVSLLYTI